MEELLPALMSPVTALEIFHCILDLPCLAASLELHQRSLITPPPEGNPTLSRLLEAYRDPKFKPLFSFIMRSEAGNGDTIDKMSAVHDLLSLLSKNPRVKMCSIIVPTLLRVYFEVILDECDFELALKLVPVMVERTCLLFNISSFQTEVKKVLTENLPLLFNKHPSLIYELVSDVKEFVGTIRNTEGREDFFIHVVWIIGEYLSPQFDARCLPVVITKVHESLETLAYELLQSLNSSPGAAPPHSPRLPSVLMATIAKLASRSQDLIPRVVVCLTKLGHLTCFTSKERAVLTRKAHELISILQVPNVASEVLSPSPNITSGRWHRDENSLQIVLRTASTFLKASDTVVR